MSTNRVGRGPEDEPSGETGLLFRLERVVGFREPEEYNAATRAFFVLVFLAALVLAVLTAMDAPTLAVAVVRMVPLGALVALATQMAGDFFYRKNRGLSAALRVLSRLVVAPATLATYVILVYMAHGVWSALLSAGLFCVVLSFAVLLNRVSGPRRPRGLGRSEGGSLRSIGAGRATRSASALAAPLLRTGGS